MDFRRYVAALLAALHLAKVTSEQQEQEKAQEEKKDTPPAEPTPQVVIPPNQTQESVPKTSTKVKATPEAKSKDKAN